MKTILCPTDFSACAENALTFANALAQYTGANLMLLHVVSIPEANPVPVDEPYLLPAINLEAEELIVPKLESAAHRLRNINENPGVQYEYRIQYGTPFDEIRRVAKEEKPDLIVMGTSGAHGLKELIEGTLTAKVAENVQCPVLVVPQQATFAPWKQILFATDLDSQVPSEAARVIEVATLFNATISFLHIVNEELVGVNDRAKDGFNQISNTFTYNNIAFFTNENKNVEAGIHNFMTKMATDLLVMVNHPRSAWDELFTHSHTQEMAYHSQIPLLVIHSYAD